MYQIDNIDNIIITLQHRVTSSPAIQMWRAQRRQGANSQRDSPPASHPTISVRRFDWSLHGDHRVVFRGCGDSQGVLYHRQDLSGGIHCPVQTHLWVLLRFYFWQNEINGSLRWIYVFAGLPGKGQSGSSLPRPRLWEQSGWGNLWEEMLLQVQTLSKIIILELYQFY